MAENDVNENPFKVRLTSAATGGGTVSFDATPQVSENRNVNYGSLDPLHAPGQIQVYKNTSSRTFNVSDIKLISRTLAEADRNLEKLWTLRGWTMPRFGNSSTLDTNQRSNRTARAKGEIGVKSPMDNKEQPVIDYGSELLGAPPPVLYLSAYSRSIGSKVDSSNNVNATNVWESAQHINRVPVVIQQLTIPYPNDVEYITTTEGVPMPVIMSIDVTLIETHSPNAYEAFNLDAYKKGILKGY